jgi:NADH-quinone oxidoreductase subunit N
LSVAQQLLKTLQDLPYFWPELWLTGSFVLLLIIEILLGKTTYKHQISTVLQILTFIFITIAGFFVYSRTPEVSVTLFQDFLQLDTAAGYYKLIIVVAVLVVLVHIFVTKSTLPAEIYSLIVAATLGAFLMVMAVNWLSLYVGLELLSVASYLLVALGNGPKPAEGGLKYLLFGAVSSAIMLYGISWIYGLTGTLAFTDLTNNTTITIQIMAFLALSGLFFKLSLVPLHAWSPDVYEAAPTPVVSFVSTVPKAAALIALMRVLAMLPLNFQYLLAVVALVSIFFGNLAALRQNDFKRLLAYSSIAQAGFLLVGIVAYNRSGSEAATFYIMVYVLMNLSAFLLLDLIGNGETNIEKLAGLSTQKRLLAVLVLITMVSMVGLPPTAGFTAKLLIFTALWESYSTAANPILLWIFGLGLLNAAISLFYYLKLPFYLFFRNSVNQSENLNTNKRLFTGQILAVILVATLLILFFKPEWMAQFFAKI